MIQMKCPACELLVPSDVKNCPKCGQNKKYFSPAIGGEAVPGPMETLNIVSEASKSSEKSLANDGLVAAQNRTTHAVRSLAITFVAAPVILLLVGIVGIVALKTQNSGLLVLVGLLAIAISVYTCVRALGELAASRI